ncbi:MAG TPA: PH domain-containing protein [Acidimicrobiales bacterium]|nr:PH domain-containing protein [Acidimicrobiales bacterium]
MPFPPKLLNENEEVVLDLRPHWWFMAGPTAALVGSIVLGIVVLMDAGDEGIGQGIKILTALIVIGCLVWFGIRYLQWVSTNFVVTTDRVVHRVGVIAKHGIEIPLERINTVFFRQSIFERLFGLGDLGIESAGERGAETFEDVRKPALVQNEIYRQMEANATRMHGPRSYQAATTQPETGSSIPAQLDQLDDLRKRGVITEAEFAAKKAELLNRM